VAVMVRRALEAVGMVCKVLVGLDSINSWLAFMTVLIAASALVGGCSGNDLRRGMVRCTGRRCQQQ